VTRAAAAPRIYFSLRSPFSWISLNVLNATRPEVLTTCDLLPYWDPAPETLEALETLGGSYHYTQMSRAKHLYILQDTKRITARLGMTMAWPVDRSPRWEIPHLAWLAADDVHRPVVYGALMEGRWQRGEDICDEDVVADLLARAGVDASLAHAHKDPAVLATGARALHRAYRDDVFGVPYFKCGSQRFWGLERVGWFLGCFDQWRETGRFAQPDAPVVIPDLEALFDTDEPGGCG
jgi:2-hydroxychromene-2-carboxylate isomerase